MLFPKLNTWYGTREGDIYRRFQVLERGGDILKILYEYGGTSYWTKTYWVRGIQEGFIYLGSNQRAPKQEDKGHPYTKIFR
jgi:hypothetical protein